MFENAIQACSELSQHVATQEFDDDGETARGAIRTLARCGVIDEQTADTLVSAVGFRNVLAHEYGHVDEAEVYDTLQTGLDVYESFSQQLARWVRDRQT